MLWTVIVFWSMWMSVVCIFVGAVCGVDFFVYLMALWMNVIKPPPLSDFLS
jgi:hypothetical protein